MERKKRVNGGDRLLGDTTRKSGMCTDTPVTASVATAVRWWNGTELLGARPALLSNVLIC
jgi:hypothetical protein